jgi:predicted nucleotidyltransferase
VITPQQQSKIVELTRRYDPAMIAVFGSRSRDDHAPDSDLDLLVNFRSPVNLLDLIGLEQELSDVLGLKVDLVTERSLSPFIRPYVERDMVRIV